MTARDTTKMRYRFPKWECEESTRHLMMHHLKLMDIQQDRQNATSTLLKEPKLHQLMQRYMTNIIKMQEAIHGNA